MSIRIRFISECGFFPWLIKKWTWASISHCEFDFGHGYLGAVFPVGVAERPYDYTKPEEEWFGDVSCSDKDAKTVEAFARAQIGKPYSLLGILGFIIKHDFNKQGSWFCSELVYASFEAAGIEILNKMDIDRISPRDVFESPLVHIEGGSA